MIDWHATQAQYGYSQIPQCKRPKIICKCDVCGKSKDMTLRVKSRVINGQMAWKCPACSADTQKLSAASKKNWQKQVYRNKISSASKSLHAKADYKNEHSKAVKTSMQNVDMSAIVSKRYEGEEGNRRRSHHKSKSIELWQNEAFRARSIKTRQEISRGPSSLSARFEAYLIDLGVRYEKEYVLGPYAFDFLIYHGDGKILVELNGDYWHNRSDVTAKDERKMTYIKSLPEYKPMVIWEYEFYTDGRVLSRLKTLLGLHKLSIVEYSLTDVMIKETTTDAMRTFMSTYHYTCSCGRGGDKYGAYLGDKLIAGIIFSPPVRKESATKLSCTSSEVLEISRFCIHPEYQKKNLASWMISKSMKLVVKPRHKFIISFADTTFGHEGIIYQAANFKHDGIVEPSYWYIDESGWIMHKKTLYEHARSLKMTEAEFAISKGYRKTYGAEKHRYVYSLSGR